MTWTGHTINHAQLGPGRVLRDLADAARTTGQMYVQFANGSRIRRWVDVRNCTERTAA